MQDDNLEIALGLMTPRQRRKYEQTLDPASKDTTGLTQFGAFIVGFFSGAILMTAVVYISFWLVTSGVTIL